MKKLLLLLTILSLPLVGNAVPQTKVNLSKLMDKEQLKATGVSKLNPKELEALESWMNLWSTNLLSSGKAAETKKELDPKKKKDPTEIKSNLMYGQVLVQENGTTWQIVSYDQFKTQSWPVGSKLSVKKNQDTLYPFTITDSKNGQTANARKANKKMQQGFKTSYAIKTIPKNGSGVTLSNGTYFKISSNEQYYSQQWKKGEMVYLIQTASTIYPYQLHNATTGQTVNAMKASAPRMKGS